MDQTSTFCVYRFQIIPIEKSPQLSLEFGYTNIEQLKQHKNEIFKQALTDPKLKFISHTTSLLHKMISESEEAFVIRLGAERKVNVHNKDFKKETVNHYPNILLLFDNRPQYQFLYIESDRRAFTSPDAVVNSLTRTINKYLKKYDLSVYIFPIFKRKDFWSMTRLYERRIERITFEFIRPNISNISESLSRDIKAAQIDANAAKTNLSFQAAEKSTLDVTPENDTISGLVEYISKGSGIITFKAKKIRKTFTTRESQVTVEFSDVEVESEDPDKIAAVLASMHEIEQD